MQTGGADIVEVGVPFSGPIADRPAIQETNLVALQNRVDYGTIFAQIKSRSEQRPYVFGASDGLLQPYPCMQRRPEETSRFCEKYVHESWPVLCPPLQRSAGW